jgi:hypothetical protein
MAFFRKVLQDSFSVFTNQSSSSSSTRVCSENSCEICLTYLLSIAHEALRKT